MMTLKKDLSTQELPKAQHCEFQTKTRVRSLISCQPDLACPSLKGGDS